MRPSSRLWVTGAATRPARSQIRVTRKTISGSIPETPLTLKAHLGYSDGNPGLGPNGTSIAPTGKYLDWLVGADLAIAGTPLTLGVAYVDTDIKRSEENYIRPNFMVQDGDNFGKSIARSQVVFSLTAAF